MTRSEASQYGFGVAGSVALCIALVYICLYLVFGPLPWWAALVGLGLL